MGAWKVQNWRKRTKEKLVNACGGKCVRCGYDRCVEALEFHHIDETKKDFGISGVINHKKKFFSVADALKNPKSWDVIAEEVKKCALLCCGR